MPAFYRAKLPDFMADNPSRIVGLLVTASGASGFSELRHSQTKAWQAEIEVITNACNHLFSEVPESREWALLLEYPIPRRQKRIDAIILAANVVFCMEFKTKGVANSKDRVRNRQAERQVEDYALDLRDFHELSRGHPIVPIVVMRKAEPLPAREAVPSSDIVRQVRLASEHNLASIIAETFRAEHDGSTPVIDPVQWDTSAYHPIPTIIEAAEALYAGHNVREIAHSHAGAANLTVTSEKLIEVIQQAQQKRQKVVCFVTGVPGAGKTLAGLNVVHNPALRREGRPPGVFLSGNGPLVRIISAAIAKDFKRRTRTAGGEREVGTFIQNVHTFVRAALEKPDVAPPENVVIFDEAQRAWDAAQTERKTDQEGSEPEILLAIMDRHEWAVVVALVGGGQEINVGEAGLAEWGRSLRQRFPHWRVVVSPKALTGDPSLAGNRLFENGDSGQLIVDQEPALHLEVSLRSFRAGRLAEWVEAVLGGDAAKASAIMSDLREFPLVLTRSFATAKAWLCERARGLRRCGLVASSGAIRLRAEGLELSSGFRRGNRDLYVNWFLAEPCDVRSSNQLEVAASEYECQGLELDWVGVCWGGDFAFDTANGRWVYHNFAGSGWKDLPKLVDRQYLLNTYRVLLTRARKGLIIWVPQGDVHDETRPLDWFDATAQYLAQCGVRVI